jgi:hypothetical protein
VGGADADRIRTPAIVSDKRLTNVRTASVPPSAAYSVVTAGAAVPAVAMAAP